MGVLQYEKRSAWVSKSTELVCFCNISKDWLVLQIFELQPCKDCEIRIVVKNSKLLEIEKHKVHGKLRETIFMLHSSFIWKSIKCTSIWIILAWCLPFSTTKTSSINNNLHSMRHCGNENIKHVYRDSFLCTFNCNSHFPMFCGWYSF